ncbi:hypothetical protein V8E53_014080 [Lactarius tabidus]
MTGEADIRQPLDTLSFLQKFTQRGPSQEGQQFVIHDSRGLDSEPGDFFTFKPVVEFVSQRLQPELPLNERIHVIWFCKETPTAIRGRALETGDEKILQFAQTNQVPIVIVITKYDQLVKMKEAALLEDYPLMRPSDVHDRGVEEAWKTFGLWLGLLRRMMNRLGIPMPPCVTVSVHPEYRERVSSLLKVTRDIAEEQVKDDILKLWRRIQGAKCVTL